MFQILFVNVYRLSIVHCSSIVDTRRLLLLYTYTICSIVNSIVELLLYFPDANPYNYYTTTTTNLTFLIFSSCE